MSSKMTRQRMTPRDSLWEPLGDLLGPVLQLTSRADLHALSLISKASCASTEPFLYSQIEWTWLEAQPPPIAAFLRTILRRPELAAYVRRVVLLGDSFYTAPWRGDRVPEISTVGLDMNVAVLVIEMTRVPYAHQWGEDLRCGKMDAFVALLLPRLQHLTHLVLSPNFTKQTKLLGYPPFQRLREVTYELKPDCLRAMSGRNTADVLPFFYLPEVRLLSLSLDNSVTFSWPMHAPDPSKVTSLNLTFIRETHLGRGLKTLPWAWYYCDIFKHSSHTSLIDLDEVATALIHVRNTLKELTISARCGTGRQHPNFPVLDMKGSLTALVDFCQLEKLHIPLPFLAGFTPEAKIRLEDVVPRYIQSLTITDNLLQQKQNKWDGTAVLGAVESWLRNWRVSNPNLITISLLLLQTQEHWDPAIREELTKLSEQCGVKAEITKVLKDM